MVFKNTIPALLGLILFSRGAVAVPQSIYVIDSSTSLAADQADISVLGGTGAAATILGVSNTVTAFFPRATAYVTGSQNSVSPTDGASAILVGPSNSLFVTSAVGVYAGGDFGGYAEVGDDGYLQAYLTSGTINANFRLGGATITATMSGGNYNQLDPNPSPAIATQFAKALIYASGVTVTQNVFEATYTGNGNSITVLPGATNTATAYSKQPIFTLLGSSNYATVQGAQTSSGATFPGPFGPAFSMGGGNNLAVMSDHAVGFAQDSGNTIVVQGSYNPVAYVGGGATALVSATGALVYANGGGTVIATATPTLPTPPRRLLKRGPVGNVEYNTITVLPSGVATISGPNQSALVQALGTLTDLGDAQVVVWSAGFAAISPNRDPLGYTATFYTGATASIAINAKAVLQDGAILQIPPMAVSRTTRIEGTDQSLVEVFAASGVAGRTRQRGRRSDREAPSRCSGGLTYCPVGHDAFECIDTASSLESCGGCWWNSEGHDCSQIEGADEVECVQGSCAVRACASGYAVSEDQATCVKA